MPRIARGGVLSVLAELSKTVNNEYAEQMGRRIYLERLIAYFRFAK